MKIIKEKPVASISSVFAIVASIWAAVMALDAKYASAQEVQQVKQDVERIKWSTVHEKALNDYYRLKNLLSKFPNDAQLKADLGKAQYRLLQLEKKLGK